MHDGTVFEILPCIDDGSAVARALWRAELRRGMQRLSPRSRWHRFASGINSLSEHQLDALTDVDGSRRVALCAVLRQERGDEGLGIARYLELPQEARVAEFALTVVDAWHRRGVGRALLQRLMAVARDNGITVLRGFVFPSNASMLALCRQQQAEICRVEDFMRVDLPLSD